MWGEVGPSRKHSSNIQHGESRPIHSDHPYLKVSSSESIYDRTYHRPSISSSASSSPMIAVQKGRPLNNTLKPTSLSNVSIYQGVNHSETSGNSMTFRSSSPLSLYGPKSSTSISHPSSNRRSNYKYADKSPGGRAPFDDAETNCLIEHSENVASEDLNKDDNNLLIRKLSIHKSRQDKDSLGFTIKSGSSSSSSGRKSRLGSVYVHRVEKGSAADKAGLRKGDQIITANHTSFLDVSLDEALEVLHSSKNLLLTVLPPSLFSKMAPEHQTPARDYSKRFQNERSSANPKDVRHFWTDKAGRPASPPNSPNHADYLPLGPKEKHMDSDVIRYSSNAISPVGKMTHERAMTLSPLSINEEKNYKFNQHSSWKNSNKPNESVLPTEATSSDKITVCIRL